MLTASIRPLAPDDIAPVAAMLRELALEFIVPEFAPEAASTFLRANDRQGIERNLQQGMHYHVAEIDGVLAGFVGMRAHQHVFHLFVGKPWQGHGLARQLWQHARKAACAAGGAAPFTINASNYAVCAYERLGFVRTGPTAEMHGVYFNPMQWVAGSECSFKNASGEPRDLVPTRND